MTESDDRTQRWIIDRFEGGSAVVEVDGEEFVDLPRWLLPPAAREDDVLAVVRRRDAEDRIRLEIRIDAEATAAAKEEAARLIDELREKDPGGDIVL